jgi:tol-pal system protein YbgF
LVFRKKTFLVLLPVMVLMAGCYGGKMLKMPINAELAYRQVDTLRVTQEEMIRVLRELSAQIQADREANLNNRVATLTTLSELEATLAVLSNKIDANAQLLTSVFGPATINSPERPPSSGRGGFPGDTVSASGVDNSPSSGGAEPGDNEGVYQSAYMDLTLGNYSLAIQGFKNYLIKFPNGVKLPEVHYYLGESYYTSERHLEAVGEFQYVIREFPDSRLVPAAMLKSGICYSTLEERTLAQRVFRELIAKYPDTEEAQRARIALEELEG